MERPTNQEEIRSGDTLSITVIEALAEYYGSDPMDLEQPLYEVIDPDALEALFDNGGYDSRSDVSVEFSYNGCRVRVSGKGSVDLSPTP